LRSSLDSRICACHWTIARFIGRRRGGTSGTCELAVELPDFPLKRGVLAGIFCLKLIQLRAEFLVLHQEEEGDERGDDRQNRKYHEHQLSHGHWASLVVLYLLF